jgi:hypothetical protein
MVRLEEFEPSTNQFAEVVFYLRFALQIAFQSTSWLLIDWATIQ